MSELLTVKQVARRLNVSRSHVYDLMHESKLPYIKIGGAYRISSETLEAWIRESTFDHCRDFSNRRSENSDPVSLAL